MRVKTILRELARVGGNDINDAYEIDLKV